MSREKCFHCGDECDLKALVYDRKNFCCQGCRSVYEMLKNHDLLGYYTLEAHSGNSPRGLEKRFDYLDNPEILSKLLRYESDQLSIITFYIPGIHCSSCIWILENLGKLHPAIISAEVNFPKKKATIRFRQKNFSLKELVLLLSRIGYEPNISMEDLERKALKPDRSLLYKIGVAGFAFGNIMLLSFPEYFDLYAGAGRTGDTWFEYYKDFFRWLMLIFALPVVFYSGWGYLRSAYQGLRSHILNIDVPIALGILALFLRSTAEILFDLGSGYFDSLSGLVFFLLIGKFFQQKTYGFLSFERDYRSYFPIAITRINDRNLEEIVPIYDIGKGDRILIRNQELIPVDGILLRGKAMIDYSFVSGEASPVRKATGDAVYAGGRQLNGAIELEVTASVAQSYLTQLWSHSAFQRERLGKFRSITDRIARHFTLTVLVIAAASAAYWLYIDPSKAIGVFTAVLIIACPCALALSAPFTLGNLLRIFGKDGFYLKDVSVIEKLAGVNSVVFDKTGTLTSTRRSSVTYSGMPLSPQEASVLKNTLRASNHPLSRTLYDMLAEQDILTLDDYREFRGAGAEGEKDGVEVKVGSADFLGIDPDGAEQNTSVHVMTNGGYKGEYVFQNEYRPEMADLMKALSLKEMDLYVLSGDNAGDRDRLVKQFPPRTPCFFNQKPEDKLNFVEELQLKGEEVLMVGDGLNDAGALAQSDVGIAVSEDVNIFSPACDGIIDSSKLGKLSRYIDATKSGMRIIQISLVFSLLYNVIGLYFAVTGQLAPVIAAILMPLSSISIVAFTTSATNWVGRSLRNF